ncbi:sugar ABC transporter ATP-binding protein [Actinoplanes couchii]|uniref:Sugar ABC transporter ATP-binding protein n=1 Tax=Actinoplanes couchii TaxID=403638 RepID=A0ABQ3XRT8_9ACTN|nr:sugar ABC transporter ATP-binding protein [Actinoplanes couchii]MDR6318470.1 erythritol transport system ATP-binding protein [Actinoplanes couchii]GID61227.1 sugar ABC transporter ATP-binding protein [Actinoplanes couchii]
MAEILEARNISKNYGGVRALKDVTFTAYRGQVNVLVGENGAGKSTLMKILSGSEQPTSGEILLDGEPAQLDSPRAAQARGIGIIHQELSLFPNLSIAENLFAGRELRRGGLFVDAGGQRRRAREVLKRLGQERLDPDTLVGDLPIGQQQLIEIGRVLLEDVRVLIMDEPTSALSNHEVDVLFEVMGDLRRDDVTVIYISHKLDEFRRIGDWVTVFRDGRLVAHESMSKTDTGWIVGQMVGRDPDSLYVRNSSPVGDVLLEVRGLTVPGTVKVDDVSLRVRAGEVVGIYGLMGAGRTELMETLMGMRRPIAGNVVVKGATEPKGTVQARMAAGLALVPEDRQRDGLVQTMSVRDNILLATIARMTRGGLLAGEAEQRTAKDKVGELAIKIPGLGALVTSLSGGNQQKVVLARALLTEPVVLLLDEPTRGIDVGAKSQIAGLMAELAAQGFGVLFISSELAEVMAMADRVLVMARGRITAEFTAENVTEEALVTASAADSVLEATT